MAFQERAIHRPDLVFLDEMMLELDDVEAENDLIEQENWEGGLVKLGFFTFENVTNYPSDNFRSHWKKSIVVQKI